MTEHHQECPGCQRHTEVMYPEVFCRDCATIKRRECLLCDTEVTYPDLLCRMHVGSPSARQMVDWYRRRHGARGSVRSVSGGLPSLGKRR
jgi:hypothetical protein